MEKNQQQGPEQRFMGAGAVVTRVFAVLGFVAVLGIGMWGSVRVAAGVPGAFSSLAAAVVSLTQVFVPANEAVTLSTPALTQMSGVPFTLSWTHAHQGTSGSYAFRFDCADGVYFASPSPSGAATNVYCNIPFNFLNNGDAITLTPFSTANRYADVTVHIDFTPTGASRPTVTGTTTFTIENDALATSPAATGAASTTQQQNATSTAPATPQAPAVPATPTAGPTTSQTFPMQGANLPSNPNGYVDLAVRIIEVGVVDRTTGAFTASSTPSAALTTTTGQYRIAVRFAIENDGTKTSPQFAFSAVLPTLPTYYFASPMQPALAPGDRVEYTLGFDQFDMNGSHVFTVNADPTGSINEPDKTNNIVHYTVPVAP